MITQLKPYPAHKPSDIEWLRDVPAHWEIQRAKSLFKKIKRPFQEGDEVVTCFRDGTVTLRKNRRESGFTESIKEIGYQGVRAGDLVIHSMDAFAGAIGISDSNGKGSPVYSVCVPSPQVNAWFYVYTLREMAHNGWIQALSKGIRERSSDFRYSDFAAQLVPLPSLSEQIAIARYLNHATNRIERYIRAKEKLIFLLKEQKLVIIHQAITGQIDVRTGMPYSEMKDSGVEWLAKIPAHWDVQRLRNIARVYFSNVDKLSKDNEFAVRLCNYSDVYHNDRICFNMNFMKATATKDEIERFQLRTGDVLITKDSEAWDDIGVPAIVESAGCNLVCGYHLALLRPIVKQISGEFLRYALLCRGIADQFFIQANGVTRFGLSQPAIKSVWVPIAPRPEQTLIVRYLDRKSYKINDAIARTQRKIELLIEYRKGLISDVVTGKLDVREVATRLPQEADKIVSVDASDDLTDSEEEHGDFESSMRETSR